MRVSPLIDTIRERVPADAVLLLLALLAGALKLYLLLERSVYIDPDEGYYCLLARNLVVDHSYTLNGLANIVYPPFLPLLIAVQFALTGKLHLALMLTTLVAGVGLGLVGFRLASRILSRGLALWAAALILFVYPLNAFLPIPRPYVDNLYRGSDILGCCLLLTAVLLVARLAETRRYRHAALAGGVFALCYLTRPEGLLLFLLVLIALTLLRLAAWRGLAYSRLLVFFLGFAVVALPYVLYLHAAVGAWSLSGKTGGAHQYHDAMLDVIRHDDWSRFHQQHYALDTRHWEMQDAFWGAWRPRETGAATATALTGLYTRALTSLPLYGKVLRTLFPWYVWVVALPGLAASAYRAMRRRSLPDLLLLLFLPFSLAVALLSYPVPRHHLFLVPVACIWAADGAGLVIRAARRYLYGPSTGSVLPRALIPALLLAWMAVGTIYEYHRKGAETFLHRPEFVRSQGLERDVARYLRKRGAGVIMAKFPGVAVRALADWQVQPRAPFADLLRLADRKNVDYITVLQRESGRAYVLVIDVRNSYVPSSSREPLRPVILDDGGHYRLAIVVKDT